MMIGDQAVGKTALLVRYADDDFNESVLPTIGIDFKIKVRRAAQPSTSWTGPFCHALPHLQTIELNGKRIKLQIWDTAGQVRQLPTRGAGSRGSHVARRAVHRSDFGRSRRPTTAAPWASCSSTT